MLHAVPATRRIVERERERQRGNRERERKRILCPVYLPLLFVHPHRHVPFAFRTVTLAQTLTKAQTGHKSLSSWQLPLAPLTPPPSSLRGTAKVVLRCPFVKYFICTSFLF